MNNNRPAYRKFTVKTPGTQSSADIAQRKIDLDDIERCLLFLLRNPSTSPVSRLWERDIKVRARAYGYEFADRPAIGGNVRQNADRGVVYGGDLEGAL